MQVVQKAKIYNGEIVAGSLLIPESRKIASLLLAEADDQEWHRAIIIENILQKRSPSAAKREAKLIRNRLSSMKPEILGMISEGSSDLATQSILACAIKHSRLLGDFMHEVVRDHWLTFDLHISNKDWHEFWDSCAQIYPAILDWSEKTYQKLRQVVFRILAEARYLDGTKTLRLLPVVVLPEVRGYLLNNHEEYVLKCMQVTE